MSLINEFAIQLYSLREDTQNDFFGVLKKLGDIGYTGVEFAGYFGIGAKEMRKALDDNKLKAIGNHVQFERLTNSLEEELEYNKIIGTEYIICPGASFSNKEETIAIADKFNKIADKCSAAGFKFGYHNHSHEFEKDGDEYLLDILYNNVDRTKTFMELDLYWATYAGIDALSYLSQNEGLVKLLHIKQIKDNESKQCVDLDEGIIDFKEIITKAKSIGVQHFILEQEEFAVSPYISIEKGFKHIMSL